MLRRSIKLWCTHWLGFELENGLAEDTKRLTTKEIQFSYVAGVPVQKLWSKCLGRHLESNSIQAKDDKTIPTTTTRRRRCNTQSKKSFSTTRGLEPLSGIHKRFRISRLNRSAKLPCTLLHGDGKNIYITVLFFFGPSRKSFCQHHFLEENFVMLRCSSNGWTEPSLTSGHNFSLCCFVSIWRP